MKNERSRCPDGRDLRFATTSNGVSIGKYHTPPGVGNQTPVHLWPGGALVWAEESREKTFEERKHERAARRSARLSV